jgi:hypothetical protein
MQQANLRMRIYFEMWAFFGENRGNDTTRGGRLTMNIAFDASGAREALITLKYEPRFSETDDEEQRFRDKP